MHQWDQLLRTLKIQFSLETDDNGGGWWDENMAGVDNEEVGCNDVWEGVGCTTLGGIEWN